jgi:all-trans-retinol 13,14-reductase
VIGAGTGGLTAAGLLARRGQSVLVVDAHYAAGGCATMFKRRGGYRFDVGVHYVGDCGDGGRVQRILAAAGVHGLEFLEMDPDGFDSMHFPDLVFRIPRGLDRLRERLVEHFPSERAGIDRYIRYISDVWTLISLDGRPFSALWVFAKANLALRKANVTLGELLDSCTRDPALRAIISSQNSDYGQPPSRASAFLHALIVGHYAQGAYYPRGGGQAISDRLADAIEDAGGKILLRAAATRILVERRRAVGVEIESTHLGTRRIRAKRVISNADIKRTYLELLAPEDLPANSVSLARGWEMSPPLGVTYLGIERDLKRDGVPNSNFWTFDSYDMEEVYQTTRDGRFSEHPFCYISIASLKDPEAADISPPGITNLQLMSVVPSSPEAWGTTVEGHRDGSYRDAPAYLDTKRRFADQMIEKAERVFPGMKSAVRYCEVSTPLTHTRFTRASGGTSYGLAMIPSQFLLRRPGPTTEIKNLYVCGASAKGGHGIYGTMISGLMVAAELLGMSLYRQVMGRDRPAKLS